MTTPSTPLAPISDDPSHDVPTLPTVEPTVVTDTVVEPVVDEKPNLNPEIDAQVKRNIKANAALNNKVIDFGSLHTAKVMGVLKDCGMDTQMAERAYQMLKELS